MRQASFRCFGDTLPRAQAKKSFMIEILYSFWLMPRIEKSTTFASVSVALRARKTRLQKLHERSKWVHFSHSAETWFTSYIKAIQSNGAFCIFNFSLFVIASPILYNAVMRCEAQKRPTQTWYLPTRSTLICAMCSSSWNPLNDSCGIDANERRKTDLEYGTKPDETRY